MGDEGHGAVEQRSLAVQQLFSLTGRYRPELSLFVLEVAYKGPHQNVGCVVQRRRVTMACQHLAAAYDLRNFAVHAVESEGAALGADNVAS